MISRLTDKVQRWAWLRNQATSQPLRAYFREKHRIDVGLYSYGCFDEWRMPGPIKVGRYCSIAKTVRSVPINHPYSAMTTHPALYEKKFGVVDQDITWDDPLIIQDDVWIGHYAVILPNCKFIGRGSIIGAGAIVTKDVAPYSIVAGNPAKVLRSRFEKEVQDELDTSEWWKMSLDDLRALVSANPDTVFLPNVARLAKLKAGLRDNG
ncbi:CatB-related O-acetyltransferase [Erythrobacter sp. SD-21]|uniref:CatB-related O-acetyltransferase n=1 Tax=Erythrobacter sp. SD-21 TaxID=161528 RepID=UPI0006815CDE|nr:CatB-related O-acetyltransferase [Erythrobacter sp. SD-21]